MRDSNNSISGVEGSRTTTVIWIPLAHVRVPHLKILAISTALISWTLFPLFTMTAICLADEETSARQRKSIDNNSNRTKCEPGCIRKLKLSYVGNFLLYALHWYFSLNLY